MCAFCGAFGDGGHWSDGLGATGAATPTAERIRRAAAANRALGLYGLKLTPWAGRYTLVSRTGKMAVVDHFGALWPEAERMAGRSCDPLDPGVIDAMERSSR